MKMNSVTIKEKIGKGGFGSVYEGFFKGKRCIVKRTTTNSFTREVQALKVVKDLEGVPKITTFKFLNFEYVGEIVMHPFVCSMGHTMHTDLFEFVNANVVLSEDQTVYIFHRLLAILTKCKSLGVFHGDVKDENILICSETGDIQLIDFGCSMINVVDWYEEKEDTEFQGTRAYNPPEFIKREKCSCDGMTVWSCGILLFNLLEGDVPWERDEDICENELKFVHTSEKMRPLISACLQKFKEDRWCFDYFSTQFCTQFPSPIWLMNKK
jgi:serine/threonine protein kinase